VVGDFLCALPDWTSVVAALDAANLAWGELRHGSAVLELPTLAARRSVATIDDRAGGTRQVVRAPYRMSASDTSDVGVAAHRGEHNREVLAEWLDLDADEVDALRAEGVLEVGAAEICGIAAEPGGGLRATLRTSQTAHYAAIINCTGPGRLVEADPLVRSLLADGLAQLGPHGLGLAVDEHGALLGRSPRPPAIYTLGSPRRGHLWETTAAPEIRAQARALADHLIACRSLAGGFGALGSCRADTAYPLPG
jgi:hypothetical protein